MANNRQGPRQPLSQRRPKVAAGKQAARVRATPKAKPRTTLGTNLGRPVASAKSSAKPAPKGVAKPNAKAIAKPNAKTIAKPNAKAVAKPNTKPIAKPNGRAQAGVPRAVKHADPAVLYDRLVNLYPDAHCELDFASPFQLLVATILSAQCTDKRVNMVTPVLFARYPTVESLARARQEDVEEIIKSTGFFRNKAKSIIAMAGAVADKHGGTVPSTLAELVALPGVGRKTANVVLGNAFDVNEGVVVDTHVGRLATRLGLTSETDPVKVEQELMQLFARDRWTMLAHLLIFHGRRVCDAKNPRCGECTLADVCPSRRIGA